MKAIGGYFELEPRHGEHYHKDAIRLNTARNCFEYVLRARRYCKVYIPYYTCEVMMEPINKLKIAYEYYAIDKLLEPVSLPELKTNEAILYTNYFGLKQGFVKHLAEVYGNRLIVDNAQAFFATPVQGIDTFYSARKFFGVPDGAYLYTDCFLDGEFELDYSYKRMSHLLKRLDVGAEFGFLDFRAAEETLCNQEIKRMSKLTDDLLSGIDYEVIKRKRRENYLRLEEGLKGTNLFQLENDKEAVPMVYPYLTEDLALRQKLIDNRVFVATYWPNVKEKVHREMIEHRLSEMLMPIPIDQRYDEEDMTTIVSLIE